MDKVKVFTLRDCWRTPTRLRTALPDCADSVTASLGSSTRQSSCVLVHVRNVKQHKTIANE